jgi:hypothetical protein
LVLLGRSDGRSVRWGTARVDHWPAGGESIETGGKVRFAGLVTEMRTSAEVTVMGLQTLAVVTGMVVLRTLTGVSGRD